MRGHERDSLCGGTRRIRRMHGKKKGTRKEFAVWGAQIVVCDSFEFDGVGSVAVGFAENVGGDAYRDGRFQDVFVFFTVPSYV